MLRSGEQHRRRRGGFTLVELLVVVLIITILATITLFALFNAGEAAKRARTRAQIAKIHDLIMPVWESYVTRRVPIYLTGPNDQKAASQLRVDAIRELMRMELPDRKSDVIDPPATSGLARPALSASYLRMATAGWDKTNQGSECLYMILSRMQDGESNGLEHIHATEIADLDGDGMREILDGWGKPLAFLRWAPGFLSPNSAIQNNTSPDPLDHLKARGEPPATYALFPLIFSAGGDQIFDIAAESADASNPLRYKNTSPPNNPFTTDAGLLMGTPTSGGKGWQDNIHNHLIDISIK